MTQNRNTFWRYVDREGNMPSLQYKPMHSKTHPYYVRYENNKPVGYHGPLEVVATKSPVDGQMKFYDYDKQEFVLADTVPHEDFND